MKTIRTDTKFRSKNGLIGTIEILLDRKMLVVRSGLPSNKIMQSIRLENIELKKFKRIKDV